LNYAIFPCSSIGAVVAGEDDRHGLLISVVSESVMTIVHSGQFESYRLVTGFEVGHFFKLLSDDL
jgi:hypothetical protein